MDAIRKPIAFVGQLVLGWVELLGGLGWMFWDALLASRRLVGRGRPTQMAWANVFAQMVRVGVRSIPIVSLVVFCIGMILAMQMSPVLETYGASSQVADIIAIAMFRELGPLVGAIVLTGFAGASIAAEIGTMVVSEEIEAMEAHSIDPIRFLVVPRILAAAVMTVCLAVVANLMGLFGGMFASTTVIGSMDATMYMHRSFDAITMKDFLTGLIKAGVFGAIIALLACYLGMNVKNGAEGVGNATTRTVVLTIVALTVVDLAFTAIFFSLDI
jgi:phospholipid/cholesterol/gamma-HCH transport system permease protein